MGNNISKLCCGADQVVADRTEVTRQETNNVSTPTTPTAISNEQKLAENRLKANDGKERFMSRQKQKRNQETEVPLEAEENVATSSQQVPKDEQVPDDLKSSVKVPKELYEDTVEAFDSGLKNAEISIQDGLNEYRQTVVGGIQEQNAILQQISDSNQKTIAELKEGNKEIAELMAKLGWK